MPDPATALEVHTFMDHSLREIAAIGGGGGLLGFAGSLLATWVKAKRQPPPEVQGTLGDIQAALTETRRVQLVIGGQVGELVAALPTREELVRMGADAQRQTETYERIARALEELDRKRRS